MAQKVEEIERQIAPLSPEQLREFRAWHENFDLDAWDRQIEDDLTSGKLNAMADVAIAAHKGRGKK